MPQSWLLTGWTSARRCCQRRARDTSLPPPRRTCRRAAPEVRPAPPRPFLSRGDAWNGTTGGAPRRADGSALGWGTGTPAPSEPACRELRCGALWGVCGGCARVTPPPPGPRNVTAVARAGLRCVPADPGAAGRWCTSFTIIRRSFQVA